MTDEIYGPWPPGTPLSVTNPQRHAARLAKRAAKQKRKKARAAAIKRRHTVGRGAEYYAYLRSDAWKAVKRRYLESKMPKVCYVCGKTWDRSFEFHHLTYRTLGNELLRDIAPVCRACHEAVHKRNREHPEESIRKSTKRLRGKQRPKTPV